MHDWMSYYDASSAEIAWTNSLHMACGAFSGNTSYISVRIRQSFMKTAMFP